MWAVNAVFVVIIIAVVIRSARQRRREKAKAALFVEGHFLGEMAKTDPVRAEMLARFEYPLLFKEPRSMLIMRNLGRMVFTIKNSLRKMKGMKKQDRNFILIGIPLVGIVLWVVYSIVLSPAFVVILGIALFSIAISWSEHFRSKHHPLGQRRSDRIYEIARAVLALIGMFALIKFVGDLYPPASGDPDYDFYYDEQSRDPY